MMSRVVMMLPTKSIAFTLEAAPDLYDDHRDADVGEYHRVPWFGQFKGYKPVWVIEYARLDGSSSFAYLAVL